MGGIVIIGGGVIGSSIACHLAERGAASDVTVIEPDPTYEFAAAPRSLGGTRILFSVPENILMSQYGQEVYADFGKRFAVDGDEPDISFRRQGYLFLASGREEVAILEKNWKTQTGLGCKVDLLDREGVRSRFPSLQCDDVDAAAHSPNDGWVDPHAVLAAYRRKATHLGVAFVRDRVARVDADDGRATGVTLEGGGKLGADVVVNAAGAWAPALCEQLGMKVPVTPSHVEVAYVESPAEFEPLPLVKDISGLSFRPEGRGFVAAMTDFEAPPRIDFDVSQSWFQEAVWPKLAGRVPKLETLRLVREWAGHYAQNTMDANVIIGPWVGGLDNFYVAIGFSGHGLQQSAAIGRAMTELLLDGGYRTIDLTRFSYQRVIDDRPLPEEGIIA